MKTHKDLDVWKRSIDFVTLVYELTNQFPKSEVYGLTTQLRRAAISIPSNIAEGASRKSKLEFKQFLYIALSSGAEIDTQIIIAFNLKYIDSNEQEKLTKQLETIQKMIQGLIKSIG
ncbi:MAG: four helix bundle protein [Spirosomataceae bacterium]